MVLTGAIILRILVRPLVRIVAAVLGQGVARQASSSGILLTAAWN